MKPMPTSSRSLILLWLALSLVACAGGVPSPAPMPSAPNPTLAPATPNVTPGTPAPPTAVPPTFTPSPEIKIALLLASVPDARMQGEKEIFIDTARTLTTTVMFNSADDNAERQKAQVAEALANQARVLVIQPVNPETAETFVNQAHKAGARVIAFDRFIRSRDLDAYVSYNWFRVGQSQAQGAIDWLTANKVKPPWNFVYLEGPAGDPTAAEITRGYAETLKTFIDKKQVVIAADVAHTEMSATLAISATRAALTQKNNNLQAVLAHNAALARGAVSALADAKLTGQVFVASAGADLESLQAICAGDQQFDLILPRDAPGEAAARLAVDLAQGQTVNDTQMANAVIEFDQKRIPHIAVPVKGITRETVQAVVVQTGLYTPAQLGDCVPPLAKDAVVPIVAGEGEINVWTIEPEAGQVYPYLANLAAQFQQANPKTRVHLKSLDAETLLEQAQSALPAVDSPDLLWAQNDAILPLARAGVLASVNISDVEPFVESARAAVEIDGDAWGLPITNGHHLILMYNKELIQTPPPTTDDLLKLGARYSKPAASRWTLVYDQTDPLWLIPWLHGFGGRVFSDTITPTLNTSAMTETLAFLLALKTKNIVPPSSNGRDAADAFKSGNAALIIDNDSMLGDYAQTLGGKLGVAPLPVVTTTKQLPMPYSAGEFFLFPKPVNEDRAAIARAFAAFVTSKPIELDIAARFRRLPARQDALADPVIANNPLLKNSAAQMVASVPIPTVTEMRCVWDALRTNEQAVLTNIATPDEAAQAMQSDVEACIARLE